MIADSPPKDEGLISFLDYIKGWLPLVWRLPAILYYRKRVANVGVENRESWGSMLEEAATKFPNNPAIKSEEACLSYREFNAAVNRCANFFISKGMAKGDVACICLENRPDLLIVYSAMAKIGAVNSMINTNLRQESLKHCLTLHPVKNYIVGEEVIDAFEKVKKDLGLRSDQVLYYIPDLGRKPAPADFIDLKQATENSSVSNPPTTVEVTPADPIAYVFTSGTTGGMPKAAILKHGRLVRCRYLNGNVVLNLKPRYTMYVPLPFFHTNALALSWPTVFANGSDIWQDFKRRFGISKVYEIYGAAESNLYFVNLLNLDYTVGRCSLPYAVIKYDVDEDAAIRDDNGFMQKVDLGETGLLLGEISESNPFVGYTDQQATESKILHDVFQRGDAWFNTGDLIRDIGYGHAQFVDRTGDTFRWKGENVSTTEIEAVANTLPQVSLSSVYGVKLPGGDGRAGMIAVIPECRAEEFDLRALCRHFQRSLPAYAVPKFLRLNADLECTATHKIKKVALKKEGFDPDSVTDALYVLLPGDDEFQPLTKEIYHNILDGKYRF